jgi:isopropylmalate/homocitrate/citramalate synthase
MNKHFEIRTIGDDRRILICEHLTISFMYIQRLRDRNKELNDSMKILFSEDIEEEDRNKAASKYNTLANVEEEEEFSLAPLALELDVLESITESNTNPLYSVVYTTTGKAYTVNIQVEDLIEAVYPKEF